MTNEAISAILEHLSNEARNSVHATFGAMELVRDVVKDPAVRNSVAIGRAGADQLLRSIDDVRELVSASVAGAWAAGPFDLVEMVSELVEMLNLASGRRSKRILLDGSFDPLMMKQDPRGVEQVLMRVLDTTFKMAQTSSIQVEMGATGLDHHPQISIGARDEAVTSRVAKWLKASLDEAVFDNPNEVAHELAIMVAGKRLRALEGWAEMLRDPAGHAALVLTIPAETGNRSAEGTAGEQELQTGALHILVAEDCDDSFALSEIILQCEQVRRAHDGREALRLLQRQRFDLVLMDVHMPGMDGYSAIRGIREWETQTGNARTPIVILSSDDLETQRQSAAQCGCSGFLRKPIQTRDVTELLERARNARTLVS